MTCKKDVRRSLNLLALALLGWAALGSGAAYSADIEKARAAYREGNGLFDEGSFAEAAAAYNRAIAENPQYAEAYHNLGLAEEMLDRKQALESWKKFVDVASGQEALKFDVARVRARMQILEALLPLPESMQPGHYVSSAGDYYWQISRNSEGEEWNHLPVKVFLGSAPEMKWQQGTREAYDVWSALFPLQQVALPQDADIRMSWERSDLDEGHAGEEMDWVQIKPVGGALSARRVAFISMDLNRRWSKDEMRAIVLHEIGHALGIKGHSDSKKDIMFWQMQEKARQLPLPGPIPLFWRSLVKQPSQRDINTLIRLYNHPGSSVRFR